MGLLLGYDQWRAKLLEKQKETFTFDPLGRQWQAFLAQLRLAAQGDPKLLAMIEEVLNRMNLGFETGANLPGNMSSSKPQAPSYNSDLLTGPNETGYLANTGRFQSGMGPEPNPKPIPNTLPLRTNLGVEPPYTYAKPKTGFNYARAFSGYSIYKRGKEF